jgi:hypothetical protein
MTYDRQEDMMVDGPETGYEKVKGANNLMPSSSTQAPQSQKTYLGRINDPELGHAVYQYPKYKLFDPKSCDREAGNMRHVFIDILHLSCFMNTCAYEGSR